MTESEALQAILDHWESGWEVLHPVDPGDPDHVPYTYDNEAFVGKPRWVRFSVTHTSRQQVSSGPPGARRFEVTGRIAVQMFVQPDSGRLDLALLAEDVRSVIESRKITVPGDDDGVVTRSAETRPARLERFALGFESPADGDWFQTVVIAPFVYYEIR